MTSIHLNCGRRDRAKGKRSVEVRFGSEWSRAEFLALLTAPLDLRQDHHLDIP